MNNGEHNSALRRVTPAPVRMSKTRRKELAQEIRNLLAEYKRSCRDDASADKTLTLVISKTKRLCRIEGLEIIP